MNILTILFYTRKMTSFEIYSFRFTIFQFLFHFRGRRRLSLLMASFPFNGVFFIQTIPNEMILLCMDYDVVLG